MKPEPITFNLLAALEYIGIHGREAQEILNNKASAWLAVRLLSKAFYSIVSLLVFAENDSVFDNEEYRKIHKAACYRFFPEIFKVPNKEEAEEWERANALNDALAEIMSEKGD